MFAVGVDTAAPGQADNDSAAAATRDQQCKCERASARLLNFVNNSPSPIIPSRADTRERNSHRTTKIPRANTRGISAVMEIVTLS